MKSTPDFPESHQDLFKTDIAMLATIAPSGHPQVTAVWFLLDEDGFLKVSMKSSRRKVRNLRENPKCTLFILDRDNPGRTLELRATAEISTDGEYAFADKIGKKYGADIRHFDREDETRVVVTLHPDKLIING